MIAGRKKRDKNEPLDTKNFPTAEQLQRELEHQVYVTSYFRILKSTIEILLVVAAFAILVANILLPVLRIYGTSMEPVLDDGEVVVAIKNSQFETGDVVAFYFGDKILIKRVIAGPGDFVNIDADGVVYVNETPLDEPYVQDRALGETTVTLPLQVPDQRYFLMGDHRNVSIDSRNAAIGCVSQEQIVGKIAFRIWPLTGIGVVR